MTTMTPLLLDEINDALATAGRQDLAERMKATNLKQMEGHENEDLTSSQAAKLLGVASTNTVKNWLKGGFFPGAFRTPGGQWRFPRHEVEETQRRMKELQGKNRRRDLAPPDTDDDCKPPLL